jgi:hypothetical protein
MDDLSLSEPQPLCSVRQEYAVMIITLLWFFCFSLRVRYSYMSNMTIFTCHCYFAIFSRAWQWQCCLTQNIFFSTIPCEDMRSWLSLIVFHDLFILGHFHMFSWILLSTLRLELAWAQGGHVSVESFGHAIMVLWLRFPPGDFHCLPLQIATASRVEALSTSPKNFVAVRTRVRWPRSLEERYPGLLCPLPTPLPLSLQFYSLSLSPDTTPPWRGVPTGVLWCFYSTFFYWGIWHIYGVMSHYIYMVLFVFLMNWSTLAYAMMTYQLGLDLNFSTLSSLSFFLICRISLRPLHACAAAMPNQLQDPWLS